MKRYVRVAALLLFLIAMLPAVAAADPMVPNRPTTATPYGTAGMPLYELYEPSAYTLEGDGYSQWDNAVTYHVINLLMIGKAWLVKIAIRAVEWSLAQDMFGALAGRTGNALSALAGSLWNANGGPLVIGALSLAGCWAMINYVRGRTSQVWGALGGTTLVLMVTALIMADGARAAGSAVELSRGLATQVFGAVNGATAAGSSRNLIVRSGEGAWQVLVFQPWATNSLSERGLALYRNPVDNVPGGLFLNMAPSVRAANTKCAVSTLASERADYCPAWHEDYIPHRLMMAVVTFLLGGLYAGAVIALAGGILLAQLALLIMLALAPVWLLVALWWPGIGARMLNRLVGQALGALITQVVLAATMAVLLLLTDISAYTQGATVGVFHSNGWMFQAIVLAALGGLAYKYRYAWLLPLEMAAARREPGESGVLAQLRSLVSGRRRPAEQAASASATATVTALVPAFTEVRPPTVVVEQSVQPAESGPVRVAQREPVERFAGSRSPREVFFSEMAVLRQTFSQQEHYVRRESPTEAARREWDEPTPAPAVTPSIGVPTAAQAVGTKLPPPQRPKS